MGKSYKKGSRDSKFDDGYCEDQSWEVEKKKKDDLDKKIKAKEKRYIEETEE